MLKKQNAGETNVITRRGIILAGGMVPLSTAHHGCEQTADAGIRQTDDPLPAQHPDAGGNPRF